jgi:hypothetical protein
MKQHLLIEARDNVAEKAAKEAATGIGRKYQKIAPALNIKNAATTVVGLGGLGLAGLLIPAAKVAAGVGAVGYAGYKGLQAGSKALPTVGKGLQKVGKGLKYTSNLLP